LDDPLSLSQASLPGLCPISPELDKLADAGAEERGAIFTRGEVVELILDLIGYTTGAPLHKQRILEPSFGDGDFLLPLVNRLIDTWEADETSQSADALSGCVRAVELHTDSFNSTKHKVQSLLTERGIEQSTASALADAWLIKGDFLTQPLTGDFDYVAGNPPYIRQEQIPDVLLAEYRRIYRTIYDRADIYVAFIERSLGLLSKQGKLGFICADRWMKNKYGGPLRQMVSEQFHLQCYIDMVDTDAFHSEVSAYPAITVITRKKSGKTRVARQPEISRPSLSKLATAMTGKRKPGKNSGVNELTGVASGAEPWILHSFDKLAVVRRLEADFPRIEETGCKVGIGVATGADNAFIGPFDNLDVEPGRKLPLAMTRDIMTGCVQWQGKGVINPFADTGKLVNLDDYPKLAGYLEARKDQIAKRHVAQKAPANWYRTIDRIYPELAIRPKLLIPDIKGEAHIVYEDGQLYPHHNLYYIIADDWDLKALRSVLVGGIGRLFVGIYTTKMRGGYLRFQAQYLRRIRLPQWETVPKPVRKILIEASDNDDRAAMRKAIIELYDLNSQEQAAL
jgi:hypothetical protein